MNTQRYHDQHQDLLALATTLDELIKAPDVGAQADAARKCLGEMAGKLTVHLAMEDQVLYPALLKGPGDTAALARRFMDEMGGIKQAFTAYLSTWPSAAAIQRDPSGFATQSRGLLDALALRIEREERELYPCAERMS